MNKKHLKFLKSFSKKDLELFLNDDLKTRSSFNIGGVAECLVVVNNDKTLKSITSSVKNYFLIGAGTNLLFKYKKYKLLMIKLGKPYKEIKKHSENNEKVIVEAKAGVNLIGLNFFLRESGISGFEWSFGIPGSVGGAIFMNAGAYEHEICEFVYSVKVLSKGKIFWTKNFSFSYRKSSFQNSGAIILAARFIFDNKKESSEEIKRQQECFLNKRKEAQPYGENCAGSVFKRIYKNGQIIYPAKLIDNLGLKGVKIGEAEISRKHAGFIVNTGGATARDVLSLIALAKSKVKKETKTILEEEIVIV